MSRWIVPTSVAFLLGVLLLLGSGNSIFASIHFPNVLGWHKTPLFETSGAVASVGDILVVLCLGVTYLWIVGLGGGGYAIVRDSFGKTECVDFREAAPAASNRDMFNLNPNLSITGGLASEIPGELRGLEYLYGQYGKLPLGELLFNTMSPVIMDSAGDNFFVSSTDCAEVFVLNGAMLGVGDVLKMERSVDLLEQVAVNGTESFTLGQLLLRLPNPYKRIGIITTMNLTLYRLVEAMRFGYAATADEVRAEISDEHTLLVEAYNPDQLDIITNHGTSYLSAADVSGMVIALTSTLNLGWGSKLMIPGLGLIMNNEMDDFSVLNRTGRSHIISRVEQMLWRLLDLGSSVKEAIGAP
ncbi:nucleophile aminohydrolase [Lasiosphaeris hirsuta]|uniref:Nucleophile aminohydrolase n=1 Tax=Lasiosphaeris hirsuta TaxID=260670 RepID=A0AA40A1S9_9PEZI|nr:nucleophile aminohydrolase [Lasiosphaeris hirsuta]